MGERLINDLSGQSVLVMRELMREGMSRQQATYIWYTSKTKKYLEDNELFYVAAMRCYWELCLERENNPNWLSDPFSF